MVYVITGKRKFDGKEIKVYRATKAEAEKHAVVARKYGATNLHIKKK